MGTNTKIHILAVDESHTNALSKDTKHLRLDGQVCFSQAAFFDSVKPRGCISWPVWGAKLILMADLASPVSCTSLGHLLMARHCQLCLLISVCFSPPTALHPPLQLTVPPPPAPTTHPTPSTCLSPIDSIRDITAVEKNYYKNQGHSNSL